MLNNNNNFDANYCGVHRLGNYCLRVVRADCNPMLCLVRMRKNTAIRLVRRYPGNLLYAYARSISRLFAEGGFLTEFRRSCLYFEFERSLSDFHSATCSFPSDRSSHY